MILLVFFVCEQADYLTFIEGKISYGDIFVIGDDNVF